MSPEQREGAIRGMAEQMAYAAQEYALAYLTTTLTREEMAVIALEATRHAAQGLIEAALLTGIHPDVIARVLA